MSNMKEMFVQEKLSQIDFSLEDIRLGDFDFVGELTAKKNRGRDSELYKTAGCFFRPNYERGILIYALIKKFRIESYMEIGFGRGYSCFCAAMAMADCGIDGKITTIDPALDENFLKSLTAHFPKEWFDKIKFVKNYSQQALADISDDEKYDLIYVDGDHTYDAVKKDWEMCKDRFNKFILFDDYHKPTKDSGAGIQCAKLIDEIDYNEKELIIMDRRIFFDDRRVSDEDIDYGQVLMANKDFDPSTYLSDW